MYLVEPFFIVDVTVMVLKLLLLDTESTWFCGVEGKKAFHIDLPFSWSFISQCLCLCLMNNFESGKFCSWWFIYFPVFVMYSSTFREMKSYQREFSSWCGGCKLDKHNRLQASVKATTEVYIISALCINISSNCFPFPHLVVSILFWVGNLQLLKRRTAEKTLVELSSPPPAD